MAPKIYQVYILKRVAFQIFDQCRKAVPNETLGRLLGYRFCWQGNSYVKIVDWIGGTLENSHIHARFTARGTRESEFFLDERYGQSANRPKEIGLFHSHPFGVDPHFSQTDYDTFLNFPYDQEGNVFVLIDPLISCFKVFRLSESKENPLQQVHWICYNPNVSR